MTHNIAIHGLSNRIHADGKNAQTASMFKNGEKGKLRNYFVISQTFAIGKLLESVMKDKVTTP